ncbi:histidine phosphatase family protein [Cellulomonas marina]|uniref:Probable phosphoglycerate mutase n=1 Tax=Cellulomonas marina TaxID=988821 RepID=A0A1I0YQG0_9CELL|nr:histidine phosphatase family protein [Cellulomonas marina]GIG27579.1 phosphoglycerate mutase [Cellulomonas marina]SFB15442.1 probable phosphoglycerate mutase [Cellulomonas marina]
MSARRVVLWRHGRTAYNATARMQGQVDIPLDEVGHWQAATAARALLARRTPDAIVTSDLVRAQETAAYLGSLSGVEVRTDERLRERSFGRWEGLTGEEIEDGWPEEFALWRAGGDPSGVDAETRAQVGGRVAAAVVEHAAALDERATLVCVAHGAAISTGLAVLLGRPAEWRGLTGMENAHWVELVSDAPRTDPAWRLTGYNLGPLDPDTDWDRGPEPGRTRANEETRDPD